MHVCIDRPLSLSFTFTTDLSAGPAFRTGWFVGLFAHSTALTYIRARLFISIHNLPMRCVVISTLPCLRDDLRSIRAFPPLLFPFVPLSFCVYWLIVFKKGLY